MTTRTWLVLATLTLIGTLLMTNGCTTRGPGHSIPNPAFRLADQSEYATERNDEAVARVVDLFADYSEGPVAAKVRKVYAERLFFRDGFKELHELDALEAYLVHGTRPLRSCHFDFPHVAFDEGNYYLRWIMKVNLKRDPEGAMQECIGMSHIRFNDAGKVVYQQDYWDPTDILYSRIPLVGWAIQKVQDRL